jgi:hypothetical protein
MRLCMLDYIVVWFIGVWVVFHGSVGYQSILATDMEKRNGNNIEKIYHVQINYYKFLPQHICLFLLLLYIVLMRKSANKRLSNLPLQYNLQSNVTKLKYLVTFIGEVNFYIIRILISQFLNSYCMICASISL